MERVARRVGGQRPAQARAVAPPVAARDLQRAIGNRAFGELMRGRAGDRRLQRAVGLANSAEVTKIRAAQDKGEVDEIADALVREGKGPLYDFYEDTSYKLAPDTVEHIVGHGNTEQLDRMKAEELAAEIAKRIPPDQRDRKYQIKIYACHVGKEAAGLAARATRLLRVSHRDIQVTAAVGFVHKTGGLGPITPPGPPAPGVGPVPYTGPTYEPERAKEYVLEKYAHKSGALDKVEKESFRFIALQFLKEDVLERFNELNANGRDKLMEWLNDHKAGRKVLEKYAAALPEAKVTMLRTQLEGLSRVEPGGEDRFVDDVLPHLPKGKKRYAKQLKKWSRYLWYRKAKLIETEMRSDVQIAGEPWKTYTGAIAGPAPTVMGGLQGAPMPRRPGMALDDDE